jgi:hypothetical protein
MITSSALIFAFALQKDMKWNRSAYLGKTPHQIFAMGRSKWHDLHGDRVGLSNADMVTAEHKYGDALHYLNNIQIKSITTSRRNWLLTMRKECAAFAGTAAELGYYSSGGGSMWSLFSSSSYPDLEETIMNCMSKVPMPMIKMKSFEQLLEEMDKNHQRNEPASAEDASKAKKARSEFAATIKKLEKILAEGQSDDRTRFRLFINRKIEMAGGPDLESQ